MSPRRTAVAIALAAMLGAAPLEAQRPTDRQGVGREQLERRIRAQMGEMMKQQLGLTDDEVQALGPVFQRYEEARRELQREERAIRARVQALVLEGQENPAEAADLVERLADLRAREAQVFVAEQEALLELLTPMQVLKLHAFREQIGERIRQLRQRGREGGPPGEIWRER